ncbi:MAG: flavodoxin-dependent (E)-4-hydroxy-3-methylbut-2-enyl-diphosphate synthase [Bulleidia sp.]
MKRTETLAVFVGNVQIGHQNRCILQSMTNVPSKQVEKTVEQVLELERGGCQIVRFAVLDEKDAAAIAKIKKQIHIPIVADIHFNHLLALKAVEAGADAIRINPGNIGVREHTEAVVRLCKERHIPIRIGINSGSLEQQFLKTHGYSAAAMLASARRHIAILEELDFHDIVLSFKSSDPLLTIEAYRAAADTFPYPLHLGVTEAGGLLESAVKSSAALGTLLSEGIGDTIRISVSGSPAEELPIGKQLLKCFHLIQGVPDLIACPTCGRIQYDMLPVVKEMEEYLRDIHADISVAVMGCPVNGMQEAARADIGVAGSSKGGILFKKGKVIREIPQDRLAEELKKEIQKLIQ